MAILDSRSGKDLFVSLCQKHVSWCGNFSAIDFVKELAYQCGWDGTKTPENRAFLAQLKDLLIQWDDVPFKKIKYELYKYQLMITMFQFGTDNAICFVHCREPSEIRKFEERLGATTLLIRRPSVENDEQSNPADAMVLDYVYNYIVMNDGTEEELEKKAIEFLEDMGISNLK